MPADALFTARLLALAPIVLTPFLVHWWIGRLTPVSRAAIGLTLVALAELDIALGGSQTGLLLVIVFGVVNAAPALSEAVGERAGPLRGRAISIFVATLFLGASGITALAAALTRAGLGIRPVMLTLAMVAGGRSRTRRHRGTPHPRRQRHPAPAPATNGSERTVWQGSHGGLGGARSGRRGGRRRS